jgi:hypothetical protein
VGRYTKTDHQHVPCLESTFQITPMCTERLAGIVKNLALMFRWGTVASAVYSDLVHGLFVIHGGHVVEVFVATKLGSSCSEYVMGNDKSHFWEGYVVFLYTARRGHCIREYIGCMFVNAALPMCPVGHLDKDVVSSS